jgi:hypothetical protein
MIKGCIPAIILPVAVILPLAWFRGPVHDNGLRAADPTQSKPASSSEPPKVAVYDADPGHLWNRLYAALYVRTTDDGQSYGRDDLDPVLWPSSTYLLTEPRHGRIMALLTEFLDKHGDHLITQPLKRAFFQNDLWAIFDWLADPDAEYVEKRARFIAERQALRNRLAPIIRRLALSDEQIETLPDTYRVALTSGVYPAKPDPAHPEKAFLPGDLFDGHGPWVHFQNGDGKPHPFAKPTALTHVHFVGGRSTFFVFMNLPGGRQATMDYMQKLNAFPPDTSPHTREKRLLTSNAGALPPPFGTQFAIVRQMMLIDAKGKMHLTPLIESLQMRVVRGTIEKESDFYEFTQHRKDLFDGKGLHAVKSDEVTIPVFNVRDEDVLELPRSVRQMREAAVKGEDRATENLRIGCISCHTQSGIASVSSFFHDRSPGLTAAQRGPEVERVIRWKGEKFNWGLLQGLATEPRR